MSARFLCPFGNSSVVDVEVGAVLKSPDALDSFCFTACAILD